MHDEGHTEDGESERLHVGPYARLQSIDSLPRLRSSSIISHLKTLELELRIRCHVKIAVSEGHKANDFSLRLGHKHEAKVTVSQDLDHCSHVL